MRGPGAIISDVDGTLLGDEQALARFARWHAEHRDRVKLAYSSGRFFASIVESVKTTGLPPPHAIIGGVGTEIRRYPSGEMIAGWTERFDCWDAAGIRSLLAEERALELQPEEFLSDLKVSYFAHNVGERDVNRLRTRLAEAGFHAQIVYSSARDLDVLPARANKGAAAAFLADYWNTPAERVLVCGDSGNDLAMFQQGFRGIIVGNALAELRQLRDPNVYHATQFFAAGVLEGVQHWWGATADVAETSPS